MHPLRHRVQRGFGMKARLVPDDDVLGTGVTGRQMFQEQAAHLQAYFRQTQKLRRIFPVHFQGRVEVAPLVFGSIRHRRTQAS